MVERLKKIEEIKNNHVNEFKTFKNNIHNDLTGVQIYRKYCNYRYIMKNNKPILVS